MAVILLSFGFCAFSGMAQNNLPERLTHVLETQDMEIGTKLYNEITEEDLKQFPDSTLFNYHYLGGYLNSEIPNHEKAIFHLLEAKRLCDTSLGTHSRDYMEIMHGLGEEYIELGKYEDALGTFEEGIVKSMYMRNVASHDFGNLIIGVQGCYELLGWFNEIPRHLSDAWLFWDKDTTPLETYTYFPLWCLEQFYKRYGLYDNALSISNQIESFIKSKGGDKHPELGDALYMKGNLLVDMNRTNEGITALQEGLTILKQNRMDNSELYEMLAGNLLMALISAERFDECDLILEEIKHADQPKTYSNALYSASNRLFDMKKYAKALSYNQQLLSLNISAEERTIVEKQKNTILYNQKTVENLSELEKVFESLHVSSPDWFETGHKLSSAYYLVKMLDKNANLLNKMYQAIDLSKSIGTDYYLWILNNLIGLSIEKEKYQDALRYSKEKWNYLSILTDVPESYLYEALNTLIVAKIKSNSLDEIDSNLEEIEKYYRTQYGEVSSEYATYLHNRGRAYQLQNKLNEAKATLLKSITIQNKVEGKPLDRTVRYYMKVEKQLGEL